jgi:hypothetical protein
VTVGRASGTGWSSAVHDRARIVRDWTRSEVNRYAPRPVVVTSPHPPEECLRRLAAVTTDRKTGWLLDARTATLPDPLLHGIVSPSGIRVTTFAAIVSRGTCAWFDAQLEPTPAGGTTLDGTIGLSSAESAQAKAWDELQIAALAVLFWLLFAVLGIVSIASGNVGRGVMAIVVPTIIAPVVLFASQGKLPRSIAADRRDQLLETINRVLDATSEYSDSRDPVA